MQAYSAVVGLEPKVRSTRKSLEDTWIKLKVKINIAIMQRDIILIVNRIIIKMWISDNFVFKDFKLIMNTCVGIRLCKGFKMRKSLTFTFAFKSY